MLTSPEPKGLVPFTAESLELIKNHIAKKCNEEHEEEDLKPSRDLEAGKQLPFAYGTLPQGTVSEPLEDVDPYYYVKRNTFMVLNRNRVIFRFNAVSILCTLSPLSSLRRAVIKVLVHPLFRLLILISVLTDSILMCMSNLPEWILTVENTLLGIYTFEILVKVIARGIWAGSFSFLGDLWNWLDFSVTLFELITRSSLLSSLPMFKTIRTLRILKIIPLNHGLQSIVVTLVQCLKKLLGAIVLALFFLTVSSLLGMGLFMGNLKHKCVRWPREDGNDVLYNGTGSQYHILGSLPDKLHPHLPHPFHLDITASQGGQVPSSKSTGGCPTPLRAHDKYGPITVSTLSATARSSSSHTTSTWLTASTTEL